MKRDLYEVLGVSREADAAEIKKTFRRVARELHPDVNQHDPEAEEKFKAAAEAYEVLSDPERRQVYDRYGHDGLNQRGYASQGFEGFGSVSDIFDAFFGGGRGGDAFGGIFGGGRPGGPVQGGDAAVEVEVTLEEAAFGTSREVEFDVVELCSRCRGNGAEPGTPIETCPTCGGAGELRMMTRTAFGQMVRSAPCDDCGGDGKIAATPCEQCDGRGREVAGRELSVDIPAGIAEGQRIRVSGRAHAGERGGPAGDLYVLVRVTEDERFVRDGDDLVAVVDLAAPAAALGTTVTVPTLDGEQELRIAAGTQHGTVMPLRGKGMPSLRSGRRGDQRVVVNVVTPRNLSADQRELLERFAATLDEHNLRDPQEDESLFSRVRRALR